MLKATDLSIGYDGHAVISDLNFTINKGDHLCIIGENGSGKTTLMRTMLGLIPPVSGKIEMDGLTQNEIGFLPQQTDVQRDFPATVAEIVLSGNIGHMKKMWYTREDKFLAARNMKRLGIEDLRRRSYSELSGGQQQRVLLARALCAAKGMILLDEPVTGLDPQTTEEMYSLISKLHAEGVTVVMITHDISAVKYATHILHIGDKLLYFGKASQFDPGNAFRPVMPGYRSRLTPHTIGAK